jgi:glutaryl-CoA dehydrogenase
MTSQSAVATNPVEANGSTTQLPPTSSDFYHIRSALPAEDQALLARARAFMQDRVAPIIEDYWARAEFPFQIIPGLRALNVAGLPYTGYGCPGRGSVLDGLLAMEIARVDCSVATFLGVHSGLAMGST